MELPNNEKKEFRRSFEFGIYEVFYDENDKVSSWTQESLIPVCPSSDGLAYEMKVMMEAFNKDILEYKEEDKK